MSSSEGKDCSPGPLSWECLHPSRGEKLVCFYFLSLSGPSSFRPSPMILGKLKQQRPAHLPPCRRGRGSPGRRLSPCENHGSGQTRGLLGLTYLVTREEPKTLVCSSFTVLGNVLRMKAQGLRCRPICHSLPCAAWVRLQLTEVQSCVWGPALPLTCVNASRPLHLLETHLHHL